MPQRVVYDVGLSAMEKVQQPPAQPASPPHEPPAPASPVSPESPVSPPALEPPPASPPHPASPTPTPTPPPPPLSPSPREDNWPSNPTDETKNVDVEIHDPVPPPSPLAIVPSPSKSEEGEDQVAAKITKDPSDTAAVIVKKEILEETKAEFPIESKKKLASKERRAKAMALMEENANAMLDDKVHQVFSPPLASLSQKQHIRKAKLLNHVVHVELQRSNVQESLETSSGVGSGLSDSQPLTSGSKLKETDKNDNGVGASSMAVSIISQPNHMLDKTKEKKHKKSKDKMKNVCVCPLCGFSGKSRHGLNKHLSKEHSLEPPFRCTQANCEYETLKLSSLCLHATSHSDPTPMLHCPTEGCNFTTTTMHRMKFHKISHSTGSGLGGLSGNGNAKMVYPCDKCDKQFSHKSGLSTHLLVHDDIKRLHCPQCPFSTKYKNHLATHMRIHRGDVLKCSVDPLNCSYSTPKKSLMTAHERAHKKERLFKCDLCDKAFVENSALTRHKRIHSDELPFACTVCSFKTRRRDKLKHHLKKKHPTQPS